MTDMNREPPNPPIVCRFYGGPHDGDRIESDEPVPDLIFMEPRPITGRPIIYSRWACLSHPCAYVCDPVDAGYVYCGRIPLTSFEPDLSEP